MIDLRIAKNPGKANLISVPGAKVKRFSQTCEKKGVFFAEKIVGRMIFSRHFRKWPFLSGENYPTCL